jgi:hypothetical protein
MACLPIHRIPTWKEIRASARAEDQSAKLLELAIRRLSVKQGTIEVLKELSLDLESMDAERERWRKQTRGGDR